MNAPLWQYDFFIAYVGPDRERASALYEALTAAGHRVFLDTEEIGNQRFEDVILPALSSSRVFLPLISVSEHDGHYFKDEVRRAIELHRSGRGYDIAPVFLDSLTVAPYGLADFEGFYFDHRGWPAISAQLTRWLNGELERPPPPPRWSGLDVGSGLHPMLLVGCLDSGREADLSAIGHLREFGSLRDEVLIPWSKHPESPFETKGERWSWRRGARVEAWKRLAPRLDGELLRRNRPT